MADKKNKMVNGYFTVYSAVAAGVAFCINQSMLLIGGAMDPSKLLILSGGAIAAAICFDVKFRESKYTKLFRACGLETKENKIPLVIKEIKNNDHLTTLVVHMPEGMSQKDFENKKEPLEQALNASVDFSFNKNLIMKINTLKLSTNYDYVYEDCKNPTEVFSGYTNEGKFYFDLDKATHCIIGGEPNGGKSSFLRTIILSLIRNLFKIELNLIDFQGTELGIFNGCKKVKSYGETPEEFEKLLDKMEAESSRRNELFKSVRGSRFVQKLAVWNKFYPEREMPYIINVIEEFARLADEKYNPILNKFMMRVAMDRKFGILYVVSVQRPDVKVINGSIKGCIPTRIAFKCISETDSKVILDIEGAEKIKKQGRCLARYMGELLEVQSLYIEPDDVRKIIKANKLLKSKKDLEEETQQEQQETKKEFDEKCINPFAKKDFKKDLEEDEKKQIIKNFHEKSINPYAKKEPQQEGGKIIDYKPRSKN